MQEIKQKTNHHISKMWKQCITYTSTKADKLQMILWFLNMKENRKWCDNVNGLFVMNHEK